ncbi:hypothetical protein V1503_23800 [Bacillus sp. SCS-151]
MKLKDWHFKELEEAYQNAYDRNILTSKKWVVKAKRKKSLSMKQYF